MNTKIPLRTHCADCGRPLLLSNLYVDDGCPCNAPRGINFAPSLCALCRTSDCVKPGHHLFELFGVGPDRHGLIVWLRERVAELERELTVARVRNAVFEQDGCATVSLKMPIADAARIGLFGFLRSKGLEHVPPLDDAGSFEGPDGIVG